MATWQEIGLSSFYAAQTLYEQKQFRSSVSRSYYAAFSVITHQLVEAGACFGQQETPAHQALPKLMKQYLTLPDWQMTGSIAIIRRLYAARIAADYQTDRRRLPKVRDGWADGARGHPRLCGPVPLPGGGV